MTNSAGLMEANSAHPNRSSSTPIRRNRKQQREEMEASGSNNHAPLPWHWSLVERYSLSWKEEKSIIFNVRLNLQSYTWIGLFKKRCYLFTLRERKRESVHASRVRGRGRGRFSAEQGTRCRDRSWWPEPKADDSPTEPGGLFSFKLFSRFTWVTIWYGCIHILYGHKLWKISFKRVYASSYPENQRLSDLEKGFRYASFISLDFYVNWDLLWIKFCFCCFGGICKYQ